MNRKPSNKKDTAKQDRIELQQQWDQLIQLLESRNRLLHETEESLKKSREFLDRIINSLADPIFVKDTDFRYLMLNDAACSLTGLPREMMIGRDDFDILPKDMASETWKYDSYLIQTGNGCSYELTSTVPGEPQKTLQVRKTLFTDEHGTKFIVGSIRDISDRIEAEQHKTLYARHLVTAIEQERRRLARELHDDLGHALTEQSFLLKQLQKSIPEELAATIPAFEQIHNGTSAMVRSLQRICTSLRPSILDELGLSEAVDWIASEMTSRAGIECNVQWYDNMDGEPPFSTEFFRIIQESLNNVMKHASATRVDILFTRTVEATTLEISDNGCGFDSGNPVSGRSFGVMGMRERARSFGATLEITGKKGKGTTVWLRLTGSGREADNAYSGG